MNNSNPPPNGKLPDDATPIAMLTVGQLRAVIAAATSTAPSDASAPMTADDIVSRRPVTPGWLREHVTACGRGARQRRLYRISDVDAALAASPVIPRPRKCGDDDDEIESMLASGELVRR